jgi:protease I
MTRTLAGRHVLMVVAPEDFRDEELLEPRAAFEAAGAVVEVAATTTAVAHGMLGAEVRPDLALAAVDPHRYAGVVLVGGSGAPAHLWGDETLHDILRTARADGTPIGAICLAPAALARAGLLRGRQATVYADARAKKELAQGGARYVTDHVVTDGGIVTAAGPRDARGFAQAMVTAMAGRSPLRSRTKSMA